MSSCLTNNLVQFTWLWVKVQFHFIPTQIKACFDLKSYQGYFGYLVIDKILVV